MTALGNGEFGRPGRGAHTFHIDLPEGIKSQAFLEGVVIAGVGMKPRALTGNERGMGYLVVKGALCTGEPSKIGVVAKDHGVVAALCHQAAQTRQAAFGR